MLDQKTVAKLWKEQQILYYQFCYLPNSKDRERGYQRFLKARQKYCSLPEYERELFEKELKKKLLQK